MNMTGTPKQFISLRLAALCAATVAVTVSIATTVNAATCIIRGDPIAASVKNAFPRASAGTSLVTGTLSNPGAASALEARYRSILESDGNALRSDKPRITMIILR